MFQKFYLFMICSASSTSSPEYRLTMCIPSSSDDISKETVDSPFSTILFLSGFPYIEDILSDSPSESSTSVNLTKADVGYDWA